MSAPSRSFSLLRVKPLDWQDPRLDPLWQRHAPQFGLAVVRDTDYLLWRYAACPFYAYLLFGLFFFNKLLGWAVIRDEGDQILLVDLLIEKSACARALRALADYFISHGKPSLRFWLPDSWAPAYPFTESEIFVANMVWKLPLTTGFVQENLYYTLGDTDVF